MTVKIIENNYRFSSCPVCNSSTLGFRGVLRYAETLSLSTHLIRLRHQPELWSCKMCHSSFTQNTIPADLAEELYRTGEGSKRWTHPTFQEDKTDAVIQFLSQELRRKSQKVLDIGCNTGEFLDFASGFNAETFGLELCLESCDIIEKKRHRAFSSPESIKQKFDLITAFDLVEHLYKYNDFFSFVNSILNPGGLLIILTGNPRSISARIAGEKWWYCCYPEHVVFPAPASFKKHLNFTLHSSIDTYASKTHENYGKNFSWKKLTHQLLSKKYSGSPSLFSDHQLIALQKKT